MRGEKIMSKFNNRVAYLTPMLLVKVGVNTIRTRCFKGLKGEDNLGNFPVTKGPI